MRQRAFLTGHVLWWTATGAWWRYWHERRHAYPSRLQY
jgi:hypothetical protein